MHDWFPYIVAAAVLAPWLALGIWYSFKTGSGRN